MAGKIGYLLTMILVIITCIESVAQNLSDQKDRQIEQVIESMAESEDGENDNPQVLDDLVKFSENQLNINTASLEELEQLHLLDFRQIRDILDYRISYGNILSKYELNTIKSLTPGLIAALEPFISFEDPEKMSKNKKAFQKLLLRSKTSFPAAKGYSSASMDKPAAYPGMPVSFYSRYHFEIPGKIELGFIADNDAGENFFKGRNGKGFDYYSGFFSWKSKSFVQQICVGDYFLKLGQGLNFWSGSGIGKSSNVINLLKTGQGVRPYTSSDENLYFRGVAAVLGNRSLKLILFYSDKNRDANISVDKASGDTVFTSLKTGGYHRTKAELEDKGAVSEQEIGGYAEWRLNNFKLGGLFCHQQFNLNMAAGTAEYKAKSFSGNENMNMGVDYQLALNKFQFFGEAALSMNQKPAYLQGVIWHAHPQLNLSFYYRYFDPGFHTFYGNPLSEGTEGRNERGFYTGIEFYPFPRVKILGYADVYHFPWLTYSTLAPSNGRDFFAQVEFTLLKDFYFYLRGKFETKPQKFTKGKEPFDFDESVNKLRLHTECRITDKFSLKNRFEYAHYSFYQISENGFLVYQDLDFILFKKIDLCARYAYFNTDGYNSRIYTYENDLLYSFSFPEFHGKGQRFYLNLKWQPTKNFAFYLKAGHTIHKGVDSWGSGNDLTMGNCRTELRAEVYMRF